MKGKNPDRSVLTRPLRLVVSAEGSMIPKRTWYLCANSSCICGGSNIGINPSSCLLHFPLHCFVVVVVNLVVGLVFDQFFSCPIVVSFDFGKFLWAYASSFSFDRFNHHEYFIFQLLDTMYLCDKEICTTM